MPADRSEERSLSLDVFRGITIAGMILVDSPGNDSIYAPLKHAEWNGWTSTDLIFPGFLVIMGVSVAYSLSRRSLDPGMRRKIWPHIFRRSAVIFAFGLLISYIIFHPYPGVRITGVLQRISLCYLACSALYLMAGPNAQALTALVLLAAYWLLMTHVPVPGVGAGVLTPNGNLASYLDRKILGGHMYTLTHDPEGILSTLSAIATAVLGLLAGEWLRSARPQERKVAGLVAAGIACAAAGRFWGLWFPINKNIWTSSFALFTGGVAVAGFGVCYWTVDCLKIRWWAKPFEIFGRNALLAYFLSGLFYGVQEFVKVPLSNGVPGDLKLWLCQRFFGSWLSPMNASLAYATAYTLLCLGAMTVLYRKRIFFKV